MTKINQQKGWFWLTGFLFVFFLTQDYLFINWETEISFLGLPNWLFWFMGVHVLFLIVLAFFSKKYWKE